MRMGSALAGRGGVLGKADGFEVFYGINEGAADTALKVKTIPQAGEQRDGYEIFYDIKQQPKKVEKVVWKHPNMTPEKENEDSPLKESPQKHPNMTPEKDTAEGDENEKPGDEETENDTKKTDDVEDTEKKTDDVEDTEPQSPSVAESSCKPPTVCAFNIATPATSFAPPLMGQCTGLPEGEPAFCADQMEGDAFARDLMSRLSGNLPRNVEAFSIATPAASFAPPQMTYKARADAKDKSEETTSSPTLSATVLPDDASKNFTPRGEGKPGESRRVVKEVRGVATRAMAGIPERPSATAISKGYPSAAPRTFTISASRFPAVVAKQTSNGQPSSSGTITSTGSTQGRASVPGNFRPGVTTVRR